MRSYVKYEEPSFRARRSNLDIGKQSWRDCFVALLVFRLGVASLLILSCSTPVLAHTRSQSFSSWYIQERQVRLSFSVQALEVTRLGLLEDDTHDLSQLLAQHLASNITVHAGQVPCQTVTSPQARTAREGYLRVEWRFVCSAHGAIEVENNAFFAVASSHIHYAR